jgi:hypothetical protein
VECSTSIIEKRPDDLIFGQYELTAGLRIEGDHAFLSEIIAERDEFRAAHSARAHAPTDPKPNGA